MSCPVFWGLQRAFGFTTVGILCSHSNLQRLDRSAVTLRQHSSVLLRRGIAIVRHAQSFAATGRLSFASWKQRRARVTVHRQTTQLSSGPLHVLQQLASSLRLAANSSCRHLTRQADRCGTQALGSGRVICLLQHYLCEDGARRPAFAP